MINPGIIFLLIIVIGFTSFMIYSWGVKPTIDIIVRMVIIVSIWWVGIEITGYPTSFLGMIWHSLVFPILLMSIVIQY